MLRAMRGFLGDNDMMAYLAMMAVRLLELHRVLKPTGSLYLHCDPTASHYLKILLDAVFRPHPVCFLYYLLRTFSRSSESFRHVDSPGNLASQ
jgi:site-specific DNA-methyltransferase (adenine-specific)